VWKRVAQGQRAGRRRTQLAGHGFAQEPRDGAFGVLDPYLGGRRNPDHRADRAAVTLHEAVEHFALAGGQAGERAAGMVAVVGEEDGACGLGP
jgi:hypothetical protein